MKGLLYLFVFSLFFNFNSTAKDADWEANISGNIQWQRVTSFGSLIVGSTSGMHGVDVESGKIIWSLNELANIDVANYAPIEGGPFVQVSRDDAIYILEPFQGNIVFDSKKATIYKIEESHILPKNKCLLIRGYTASSPLPGLFMFDLATGEMLWNNRDNISMLTAFLELGGENFMIATLWEIYKINSRTGQIIWQQAIDEETSKQIAKLEALGEMLKKLAEKSVKPGDVIANFYTLDSKRFLMGYQVKKTSEKTDSEGKKTTTISYESGYKCLAIADGKSMWNEAVSFKGKIGTLIFGNDGMIVCPDAAAKTRINYVDFKTGEVSWGKKGNGIKMKGTVNDFVSTDAGIMLLSQSGGSSEDPNYIMNLLDPVAGVLLFDKYAKVKGEIVTTELIGDKLFYATNKEAGVIDVATGAEVIDKPIKTSSGLTVSGDNSIFVFCTKDNNVYKIDKATGRSGVLSNASIDFQGKDNVDAIEIRESGISLSGFQNVALVQASGDIAFNKYYPAPRLPGIIRALNAAAAVRAYYIGAVSKMAAGAWGAAAHDAENPLGAQISMGISEGYNELGNQGFQYANMYMEAVNKRFSATANAPDFVFMVTEAVDKNNHLIRVSKETGEVLDYIDLGSEKEPEYEVDNISSKVYHRTAAGVISAYSF